MEIYSHTFRDNTVCTMYVNNTDNSLKSIVLDVISIVPFDEEKKKSLLNLGLDTEPNNIRRMMFLEGCMFNFGEENINTACNGASFDLNKAYANSLLALVGGKNVYAIVNNKEQTVGILMIDEYKELDIYLHPKERGKGIAQKAILSYAAYNTLVRKKATTISVHPNNAVMLKTMNKIFTTGGIQITNTLFGDKKVDVANMASLLKEYSIITPEIKEAWFELMVNTIDGAKQQEKFSYESTAHVEKFDFYTHIVGRDFKNKIRENCKPYLSFEFNVDLK